jgi:NADH-quinone oxidoreductase subunit H
VTAGLDLAEGVGLTVAALVLAPLVPFTAAGPFAAVPYGLFIILAGYAAIALTLVVAGTAGDDGMDASGRPGAAVVWAGCGVAMLLAILAVVAVAQTMDLGNIVLAQQNTLPYALVEPVAALVFVVALAVLWSHRVRPPGSAPPAARRLAEGLHLFVCCSLGSTLFLAGYAGPVLPGPVWLVAKSVALVVAVLMLGRRLARLPDDRRRVLAWRYLAPFALLNFIGTLVLVGRPR